MRTAPLAIALLLIGLPVCATQTPQSLPNFTGRWDLAADREGSLGEPAFGSAFTAAQSGSRLIVDYDVMRPGGRGQIGLVRYGVHLVYAFDGTETNEVVIAGYGSRSRMFDVAAWNQGRLEIQHITEHRIGRRVAKQVLSLDADGYLIVDTSSGGTYPEPTETKTRAFYRRDRSVNP